MDSPEKPTPIERLVQLIPLKYPLAALAWTIILGPFGYSLASYVQSQTNPFQIIFSFPGAPLSTLLVYYSYYVVRYLRLRIVRAEPQITPIMSGGDSAYRSVFGQFSSNRRILTVTVILEALTIIATSSMIRISLLGIYNLITQFILILAFSSLIWEYAYGSWGLHRLGRTQLRLKSFLEDHFMGARSVGNVALSLTIAYLGGLLLFFLDTATFLPVASPPVAAFFLCLLALGVVMFFLPLNSVHSVMQSEKAGYQVELSRQLMTVKLSGGTHSSNSPATLEDVRESISHLVRLKDFEMTERKLASTPTWPFDIQLIAKLITITLSVTAVLLTRLITDYLIHI